jgi:hypothetical protein
MMKVVLAMATGALAYGCNNGASPTSRILGDNDSLSSRFARHCRLEFFFEGWETARSLPDVQATSQYGCRFPGSPALVHLELQGDPQAKLDGYHEVYTGGGMCSIRLGPAPLAEPTSMDWVIDTLDDPLLAARIKHAIGTVDLRSEFTIALNVDGVHVRYWQHSMGWFGRDPYFELLLDGCRHVPDETVIRRKSRGSITFDSDRGD